MDFERKSKPTREKVIVFIKKKQKIKLYKCEGLMKSKRVQYKKKRKKDEATGSSFHLSMVHLT